MESLTKDRALESMVLDEVPTSSVPESGLRDLEEKSFCVFRSSYRYATDLRGSKGLCGLQIL